VEEWWVKDVKIALSEKFEGDLEKAAETGLSRERFEAVLEDPFNCQPTAKEALFLSLRLGVPLHPKFTFFWSNLSSVSEVEFLRKWLSCSEVLLEEGEVRRVVGEFEPNVAQALKRIFAPHKLLEGKIVVEGDDAWALAFCLGYGTFRVAESSAESALEAVNVLSGLEIRDKAPTFVGARMGRPEKAKRREMKPLVHVLFPVSLAGGSHRDLVDAAKKGPVFVEVAKRKCPDCKSYTFKVKCNDCGSETQAEKSCPRCGRPLK
jgi:DNA polymerase II large subunit